MSAKDKTPEATSTGSEPMRREEAGLPAEVTSAFDEVAGMGMETVDGSDLLIPRLAIAQALSPQLNAKDASYIEGAAQGDIIDTAMGGHWKAVLFLPVVYRKQWIEWAPRATNKGIVNIHDTPDIIQHCTPNERGVPTTQQGNTVVETGHFFGFHFVDGEMRRSFIAMASSQLRPARKWIGLSTNEKIQRQDGSTFTPPLFYRFYALSTVELTNAQGSWHGWKVERAMTAAEWAEANGVPLLGMRDECIDFHKVVTDGSARPQFGAESADGQDFAADNEAM